MIRAFFRAFALLFDGRVLGIIGACAVLSLGCFVAAWYGMHWLIATWLEDTTWARTTGEVLGGFAAVIAAWFLFPMVASAFVCLFLDRIARIVESRSYRDLPPAPGLPMMQAIGSSIGFLVVVIVANLALLVLWLFPIAYPIAYFVVNGMLLGREYFELVALRRLDTGAAKAMRRRNTPELWLSGTGFALLSTLPFVNLVLPVLATAAMVHRFEEWRRASAPQAGGG